MPDLVPLNRLNVSHAQHDVFESGNLDVRILSSLLRLKRSLLNIREGTYLSATQFGSHQSY